MSDDGPRAWGAPLYERVIDVAGAGPGTDVLDLGCGAGEFARLATDRGATVTGIDVDPSAVAAAAARVPEAVFRIGDAHDPPPGRFDVVAAVQLLEHVANPLAVLRAAAGSGPVVVVTVWGREQECDVQAFGEALAPWLPPRPTPSGPPPVTDPDRLRRLVGLAGLRVHTVDEVTCRFDYPDADALVAPLFASGFGRHVLNRAGPEVVRNAVLTRLADRRTPAGSYVLENLFRVFTAYSPAHASGRRS